MGLLARLPVQTNTTSSALSPNGCYVLALDPAAGKS